MANLCQDMLLFLLLLLSILPTNAFSPSQRSSISSSSSNILLHGQPTPIDAKDWPQKFPAKEHCSKCGLCETSFVQYVETSCAFLKEGMSNIDSLEPILHKRSRNLENDYESRFGVLDQDILLVKGTQNGSQWTGAVTSIALAMLESKTVDAAICIASKSDDNTLEPQPIIAKTKQDLLKGRGVKPSLAPSLKVLDEIKQDESIRNLLFCGVGCAVQAFRSELVQKDLGLDNVYVLGTNCADNSPTPQASQDFIQKGLGISEEDYESVKGYEFMQDFKVHVKKETEGSNSYDKIPYFSLPGNIARASIASSCLSCFDYTNSLADIVVGYMGALLADDMDNNYQTLTIRNQKGKEMFDIATKAGKLNVYETATGKGSWKDFAVQTVLADGVIEEMIGKQPKEQGMPPAVGNIVAKLVQYIGPKGLNFAEYSIDYHILRNYLYCLDQWGENGTERKMPQYAQSIVKEYLKDYEGLRTVRDKILAK
ncbi:coenzyme F420 hydrogenase subunit beta [Chaetoceros tenuissimus]|uniref:Coenzyme F420 hydrogenase subunit beta n=1 Tax=Chaetoceros tenuissimus TaxID=426638 RepID=A0AAD3H6Y5_9STRA|nr:coenzyme F420 hydrogenase subunit beta [Chaetoceros tenuissimus]